VIGLMGEANPAPWWCQGAGTGA